MLNEASFLFCNLLYPLKDRSCECMVPVRGLKAVCRPGLRPWLAGCPAADAKNLGLCPFQPCSHTCHHNKMAIIPLQFTAKSWLLICGMPSARQSPLSAMTKIWVQFSMLSCGLPGFPASPSVRSPNESYRNLDFRRGVLMFAGQDARLPSSIHRWSINRGLTLP